MKKLNNLILAGILTFSIPLNSSFNFNHEKRIPLEKKLREIEADKNIPGYIDCKHKAWRYYLNTKEAGENLNLIIGWLGNADAYHAYLKDKAGRIYDPLMKSNEDGVVLDNNFNYYDIYIFDSKTTIEEFVNYKFNKKIEKNMKRVKESETKIKKRTISEEEIIKRIENYCKQDTTAWKYYQKNIAKNNR
jgi:hypothetical protein